MATLFSQFNHMESKPMSEHQTIDFHYCPKCGYRMTDVELMSIIIDAPCPGRGDDSCGTPISRFLTKYKTKEETDLDTQERGKSPDASM